MEEREPKLVQQRLHPLPIARTVDLDPSDEIAPRDEEPSPRPARDEEDALLNIIGIGASTEPTDIARDELEYLAEAYAPSRG